MSLLSFAEVQSGVRYSVREKFRKRTVPESIKFETYRHSQGMLSYISVMVDFLKHIWWYAHQHIKYLQASTDVQYQ